MSRARTFADLATASEAGSLSNRNLIGNGNFAVHQRTGTITGLGDYNLDRWQTADSGDIDDLAIEVTQSADTPDGVGDGYSLKYQTKTVESAIAAGEYFRIQHSIEARDLASLCYGTSSAKSVTLSFWVKSSLTGTFGVSLYQDDGSDIIGSTYTISSANTWEKKTITFSGNTAEAIVTDNGIGIIVLYGLWIGSNYTGTDNSSWGAYSAAKLFNGHTQNGLATTDESTWQIAFVQLEIGEVATPFEHESFADNFAKCQRYYQKSYDYGTAPGTATNGGELGNDGFDNDDVASTGQMIDFHSYYCEMRAAPTFTAYDIAGTSGKVSTTKHGINEYNGETGAVFRNGSKNYSVQRPATGNSANSVRWHFTATADL